MNGGARANGNGKVNGEAKAKANNNGNGKTANGNGKTVSSKNANAYGNGAKIVKTEKAPVGKITIAKKSETTKKSTVTKTGISETKAWTLKTKGKAATPAPTKTKVPKTVVERVKVASVTQKPVFRPTPASLPIPSKPRTLDVNNVKSATKKFPPFDKAVVHGATNSSPKKKTPNGYQQVQNQEPVSAVQSCIANLTVLVVEDCIHEASHSRG